MVSSGPNKRKRVGLSLTISAKYFDKTFISILSFVSGSNFPRLFSEIGFANSCQSGKIKLEESTPPFVTGFEAILISPFGAKSRNSSFKLPSALNKVSG